MAVDAAEARDIQHCLGQDQPIGDHHQQIRLQRRQFGLGRGVLEARRLQYGNGVFHSELLDRAGHQLLTTAGRAIRLGVHRDDLVRRVEQGLEVFINPQFESLTEEMDQYQEGCLSVPGFYENVDRPQKVKINALDRDGKPFEMIAEGLLAVCIQHECDHLNGKLFVDYLSTLKRDRIKKKLEKQHRQQA